MRALLVLILPFLALLLSHCDHDPGQQASGVGSDPANLSCRNHSECPTGSWCLHQRCSAKPPVADPGDPGQAALAISPGRLNFGTVAPGNTRTLPVIVTNSGSAVVTLTDVALMPKQAPFKIETLGYGPFWLRPGRDRELLITFAPVSTATESATLTVTAPGLTANVTLSGN